MAGELVKWNGGQLVKPSPVEKSRKAREAALALLGPQERGIERSLHSWVADLSSPPYPGLAVDLARVCAVHKGGPYSARYIFGNDGHFRLGSMIVVTEALYMRQYGGNGNTFIVPGNDLAEETCPLCGASGPGSVLCHVCHREVCYGRTSGRYFRCFPGCGAEGVMKPRARVHWGVTR